MFRRKSTKPPLHETDTLVGPETVLEGVLKSKAAVRIEGHFSGNIECEGDVTIGETGIVRSSVAARNVTVAGRLEGDVTARGKLVVTFKGRLFGDVSCETLVVEEGGVFRGNSRMPAADPAMSADETKDAGRHPASSSP
ncbi:MAG: hypothetical protein BLM47_11220 [Candidatus Reconcilbacillus cellulovorans]|uniref:Cell shape determination protein CcmA n=1 Tax=Candidatus Reconcilbacillus cellulovorans TaxID=1906605 RepID=A0A2A6DY62_9BACL|nr:MAG: hypothetical protein BLM47_11220 [Candidatus Reconcilbacillus cellulovorans]